MKLKTKRLVLREYEMKDAKSLAEHINHLKISRYMEKVPYPYTLKDAQWFLNKSVKEARAAPRKEYDLCINLKGSNEVIGAIGIMDVDRFAGTATFGYWLNYKYWRKGYMTEAVKCALDFAFKRLKLRRIDVDVYTRNDASNALARKLEFKLEGVRRKYKRVRARGKIVDTNVYGLLKKDWTKHRKRLR